MSKRMFGILNLLVFSVCMLSAQAKSTKTTTQDTVKATVKAKTTTSSKTVVAAKSVTQKQAPSVKKKAKSKAVTTTKTTVKAKPTVTKTVTTTTVKKTPTAYSTVPKPVVQIQAKGEGFTAQSSVPMSFNNEMLAAVNALRKSGTTCGGEKMPPVKALAWNTKLENAAIVHANDMDGNDNFSHRGMDGTLPDDRIKAAGYEWERVGENIGQGYKDVSAAMKGWKESTNHCKQLMNADVTEIGAAKKGKYWCQTFAKSFD